MWRVDDWRMMGLYSYHQNGAPMSTGNTNTAAKILVPCPKCCGGKTFSCWSHIAGGTCFCCAGNGDVEISRAVKFGYVAPAAPAKNVKDINLGGVFGTASVTKIAGGWFRVDWGRGIPGESTGCADFRVVGGKIVDLELSDSPRRLGYGPARSPLARAWGVRSTCF